MAEHEDMIFEHEIAEKLKKLDSEIKIPEIPDAQGIFELAEKKTKVVFLAKYRKFATAAAAVVLIAASVPVFGALVSGKIGMDMAANEAALEPGYYYMADEVVEEAVMDVTSESKSTNGSDDEVPMAEEPSAGDPKEAMEEEYNGVMGSYRRDLEDILYGFFYSEMKKDKTEEDALPGDSVSEVGAVLNSKRSINIEVEGDSVSVLLYDTSADNEVISAFWVEGIYQGSGEENGIYYINLSKKITKEDFDSGNWIPMAGDAEKGGYFIDENIISISEIIECGIIEMRIEIDIATGEYEIIAKIV